jgi:large subunit ribosomal protein L19
VAFNWSFYLLPPAASVDQIPREALKTDGPGARVSVNGQVCSKPQEAKTNLLNFLTQSDLQKRTGHLDIPYFVPGSILAVTRADPYSKSGESRFVGICIARHNKGVGSNFILRNVVNGVAVEVRFELYSPVIKKIEVLKLERRRRAKLYYLRKKSPRENTFSETMKPTLSNKLLVHKRRRK